MADGQLPKEVRELVRRRLRNMEEIDVLLLLASAPQPLTADQICTGLRIPPSTLSKEVVDRLVSGELIAIESVGTEPRFRYAPATTDLRKAVALLAIAYNEKPVSLVRLVYHRDEPTPTFNDAFKLGDP